MNGKFLFLAKRIKYSTAVISKTKVRCAAISFILKQYCTCSLIAVVLVSGSIFSHSQKIGGRFLQFELSYNRKAKEGRGAKTTTQHQKTVSVVVRLSTRSACAQRFIIFESTIGGRTDCRRMHRGSWASNILKYI